MSPNVTKRLGTLNLVCVYLETVLKVLDAKAMVNILEHKTKGKKVVYHGLCTDKTDTLFSRMCLTKDDIFSGHFQDA